MNKDEWIQNVTQLKRNWLRHDNNNNKHTAECRMLWTCHKWLRYLLQLCVLFGLVEDLPHGHEHWQHQSRSQHDEDPSDVLHPQSAGLFALLFRTAVPPPPLLLHHVQLPFLLQLQNGYSDLVSVRRACGDRDTTWITAEYIKTRDYAKVYHSHRWIDVIYIWKTCIVYDRVTCYCWLLRRRSFFFFL